MPDYTALWRLKTPSMGGYKIPSMGRYGVPEPPAIPKATTYPELDIGGYQNWLTSMLARQLMPGRLYPEQIAGTAYQMLGPLMQMKANYPFQRYEAEESARRWGAGMGTDIWKTQAGLGADIWSKMLQASLARAEMAMKERMWEAEKTGGIAPSKTKYWGWM